MGIGCGHELVEVYPTLPNEATTKVWHGQLKKDGQW